jgi:hypothetical protein
MAILARRTWEELRDGHVQRVGRANHTAYEPRAERFLEASQFELGVLYHHYELDKTDATLTSTTNDQSFALPADLWGIFGMKLLDNGDAFLKTLRWKEAHAVLQSNKTAVAQPSEFTRFGRDVRFEQPTAADYHYDLYYYAIPTAPDFDPAAASPDLGREWDEVILDYSVWLAKDAIGRPDLAMSAKARVDDFLSKTAQPLLAEIPLYGIPERRQRDFGHGGGQ